MRRDRKKKRRAYTATEIANFARLLRKLLGIHNRHGTNILEIFALLQKLFPKLRLRIVANDLLPNGEARAYPKSWIIKIRQSVLDGLLRGDYGARWTLAHELGHVLLQHPGKPFRQRCSTNDDPIEREAHIFAAELLAPSEHAKKYNLAEDIRTIFQISLEAAQRRIDEIALEARSKQFGTKRKSFVSNETTQSENLAAIVCAAISATVSENSKALSTPIRPFRDNIFGTSILVAQGARLLSDSYGSVYGSNALNELTYSATAAAAILAIRPIRGMGSLSAYESEIVKLNEICALKVASILRKITIDNSDTGIGFSSLSFPSGYLNELVRVGEHLIVDSCSVIHFCELPFYYEYNAKIDVSWNEINSIKNIINLFAMLQGTTKQA